jgi:hypothetical protein
MRMTYRDDDALYVRVARLEGERVRVRARANRLRRRARLRGFRVLACVGAGLASLIATLFILLRPCGCIPKTEQARADMATIRPIVEKWRVDHGPGACPTVATLQLAGELTRASACRDPWDHDYLIWCRPDESVTLMSAGPDGRFGTRDDVVFEN